MKFTFKTDTNFVRVHGLVNELPERVEGIIHHFPEQIAKMMLQDLVGKAPKDIPGYPKMLQLRRLDLPVADSTVGLIVPGYEHSYRLRPSDVMNTVLYVRSKVRAGAAPDPAVVILSNHNPWTMGTLPFEPHRRQASLMSRRVTRREVLKIEKKRMAEREGIDKELEDLGIKPSRFHPTLLSRRVSRDIAFEVLRREFGIEVKPHAHWRPALGAAKKKYPRRVMKMMIRWLAVPSESRWKRRSAMKVEKATAAKRVRDFQQFIKPPSGN